MSLFNSSGRKLLFLLFTSIAAGGCTDDSDDTENLGRTVQAVEAAATVSSDKADYSPGETALLSGSGWQAGEAVTVNIDCTTGVIDVIDPIADAAGAFADAAYPITQDHLGATCFVTATGQTSGRVAETTFTDGNIKVFAGAGTSFELTYSVHAGISCSGNPLVQGNKPVAGTKVVDDETSHNEAVFDDESIKLTVAPKSVAGGSFVNWTVSQNTPAVTTPTATTLCLQGFRGDGNRQYTANYGAPPPPPTNRNPSVTCESVTQTTAPGTCSGSALVPFSTSDPDGDTVTCTQTSAPLKLGANTVTVNCTDGKGGTASCTATVTLTDAEKPSITCPAATQAECTSPLGAALDPGDATASDACGVASITDVGVGTYQLGPTDVTYRAFDAANNNASCTTTVVVVDTTAPAISCPADVTRECTAPRSDIAVPAATATDACATFSVTGHGTAGYSVGTTAVTQAATDTFNNSRSCTSNVTVVDTTAPSISCPADVATECTGASSATVGVLAATAEDLCGDVGVTGHGSAVYPVGNTTVTQSATDAYDNSSTCTSTVTVQDTIKPTISCPELPNAECTGNLSATVVPAGVATASDTCSAVTVSSPGLGTFGFGPNSVAYSASDEHGNESSCLATLTVVDTQAPTITCPGDVTVECTSKGAGVADVGPATTADACGPTASSDPGVATYAFGTTSVRQTTDDGRGNTSSCSSSVTVADTKAPTIACPAPVTAQCTGNLSAQADPGDATASDVCSAVTVFNAEPGIFNLGTTPLLYSAKDESGHTSSCPSSVTVVDTAAPTIACPANATVECTGNRSADFDVGAATTSDVCGPTSSSDPAPATYGFGTTSVTQTTNDGRGNTDSCSSSVTVADTTEPTISCPAAVTVECSGNRSAVVDVAAGTGADICGGVTVSDPSAKAYSLGTTTVTETATDQQGLTATCDTSVTVEDTTAPTFAPAAAQTLIGNCSGAALAFTKPSATDGCDSVAVTCDALPGNSFGANTVTCTATDPSGNSATTTVTVTVLQPLRVAFLAPLADDNVADNIATDADVANIFQVKSTIPHQVHLFSCSGADVTSSVAVTVNIAVTLKDGASTPAGDNIVTTYTGVGDAGGVMVLVDGKYKYNLKTNGYQTGTASSSKYFNSTVNVAYTSAPGLTVGAEDVRLESK